jgi:hypothetical protein
MYDKILVQEFNTESGKIIAGDYMPNGFAAK